MKPHTRVRDVQSTLTGEKVSMSIDAGAMAHIMGILTDLYSDPEMAVIREYATNGYDAHVEAGVTLPIEVTLPTNLSPYLTIRDYGNGLNADDIREMYSRYGASSKRETNDQVGSLGLGCKSALTYTDQFTLQGIKNGVATQVSISRDEDGSGSMTIVAEYETDEASGVEITIPAKTYNSFAEKAQRLFQFWAEGTVLVNGEEPKRFEGLALADDLYIVDKQQHDSVVVMGGVPYEFNSEHRYQFSVIAFVEMGAVQFTPSRESLQMTPQTKAVVEEIDKRVENLKESAVMRLVDEATSKPEALKTALEASRLFNYDGELTYKNKPIPAGLDAKRSQDGRPFVIYRPNSSGRRYYGERKISTHNTVASSIFPTSLFFVGFKNKGLNPTQREKIEQYLADNQIDTTGVQQYVFVDTLEYSSWIEKGRVHDWEKVKAIKLPKAGAVAGGRVAGSYDVVLPDFTYTQEVLADDLEGEEHIFWWHYGYGSLNDKMRDLLRGEFPDAVFVQLKQNRVAKFQRDFSDAREVYEAARLYAQEWFDGLTDDQRNWLSVQQMSERDRLADFDEKKIEDPLLSEIITLAKKKNPKLLEKAKAYRGMYEGQFEDIDWDDNYPLLKLDALWYARGDERQKLIDHMTFYLNAVYAASTTDNGKEEK